MPGEHFGQLQCLIKRAAPFLSVVAGRVQVPSTRGQGLCAMHQPPSINQCSSAI